MNPEPPIQIKLNSWLWPAMTAGLLGLNIFFPYQGWMVLIIGMGLVWLTAWLWTRQLARNLFLIREMRFGWAQVGDLLEERFILKNTGLIPAIWVEIRDHSTLPDYQVSSARGIEGQTSNSWITRQVCTRRGLFHLGPTTLSTGDPFGIYSIVFEYSASATILVTPPILPLPSIQIQSRGQTEEGRISRKIIDSSPVMLGVREYSSGDSLHRVHWPTTARRESLFVKTSVSLPSGNWWIVLDLDRSAQLGQGPASTEETAVLVAAAAANRGLEKGAPVGLIVNGQETTWLPPRLGVGQRQEILQALAKAAPGENSLERLLRASTSLVSSRSSLIIITACAEPGWLVPLLDRVQSGVTPTVLLLDPAGFGGASSALEMTARLAALDVPFYLIQPDTLPRTDLYVTAENRWEWRRSPSGRVIAIHKPPELTWKLLQ